MAASFSLKGLTMRVRSALVATTIAALLFAGCKPGGGGSGGPTLGGSSGSGSSTGPGPSPAPPPSSTAPDVLATGGPANAFVDVFAVDAVTGGPLQGVRVTSFGSGSETTDAAGRARLATPGRHTITVGSGAEVVTIYGTNAARIVVPLRSAPLPTVGWGQLDVEITGLNPAVDTFAHVQIGASIVAPPALGGIAGTASIAGRSPAVVSLPTANGAALMPYPGEVAVRVFDAQMRPTRAGHLYVAVPAQRVTVPVGPATTLTIAADLDASRLPAGPRQLFVNAFQRYGAPGTCMIAGSSQTPPGSPLPATATIESVVFDPTRPLGIYASVMVAGASGFQVSVAALEAPVAALAGGRPVLVLPAPPTLHAPQPLTRQPRFYWTHGTAADIQLLTYFWTDGLTGRTWRAFIPGGWNFIDVPPEAAFPGAGSAQVIMSAYTTPTRDNVDDLAASHFLVPLALGGSNGLVLQVP